MRTLHQSMASVIHEKPFLPFIAVRHRARPGGGDSGCRVAAAPRKPSPRRRQRRCPAAALKSDSDVPLTALFGEEHKVKLFDPDPAAAKANRARIVESMQSLRVLKEPSADRRIILIGDKPGRAFPIVKTGDRWRFATEDGIEELINRRIGGNERNAIFSLRAFVDAQRAYAARDRDGDGVLQYAQKIMSSPGKQDGLYWPADPAKGEEASPFDR